jgi:hypothetical protein
MIDEMIAAGKTEQEICTAICKQYEPYDTVEQFGEDSWTTRRVQATARTTVAATKPKPMTAAPTPPCGFGWRSSA